MNIPDPTLTPGDLDEAVRATFARAEAEAKRPTACAGCGRGTPDHAACCLQCEGLAPEELRSEALRHAVYPGGSPIGAADVIGAELLPTAEEASVTTAQRRWSHLEPSLDVIAQRLDAFYGQRRGGLIPRQASRAGTAPATGFTAELVDTGEPVTYGRAPGRALTPRERAALDRRAAEEAAEHAEARRRRRRRLIGAEITRQERRLAKLEGAAR